MIDVFAIQLWQYLMKIKNKQIIFYEVLKAERGMSNANARRKAFQAQHMCLLIIENLYSICITAMLCFSYIQYIHIKLNIKPTHIQSYEFQMIFHLADCKLLKILKASHLPRRCFAQKLSQLCKHTHTHKYKNFQISITNLCMHATVSENTFTCKI